MTAYATGTATDAADLFSKLDTFLRTDATLVSESENWSVAVTHSSTEKVYNGPGLAGTDDVLIGLKLVSRPSPDEYEIQMVGMTGTLGGAGGFDQHVNTTPQHVRMFVDSGSMTYWFIASGRRFVVIVKISTVFQAMYGGFFLPYAAPTDYPYPLFVGGSAGQYNGAAGPTSWRSVDAGHAQFPCSYYDDSVSTSSQRYPSALMLSPQGDWLKVAATGDDADVGIAPRQFFSGMGVTKTAGSSGYGYDSVRTRLQSGFNGEALLTPLTLVAALPGDVTYGALDGCYHVPGYGNSSEDLVTVAAVNHLVVQDTFRSGIGDYWALALA